MVGGGGVAQSSDTEKESSTGRGPLSSCAKPVPSASVIASRPVHALSSCIPRLMLNIFLALVTLGSRGHSNRLLLCPQTAILHHHHYHYFGCPFGAAEPCFPRGRHMQDTVCFATPNQFLGTRIPHSAFHIPHSTSPRNFLHLHRYTTLTTPAIDETIQLTVKSPRFGGQNLSAVSQTDPSAHAPILTPPP